ncbi:MAG TPA: hypothetical protein VFC68_03865 [Treponemataceae bacterium]|nr:hypothetical protein [Treponemataceae bacterium]
MKYFRKKNIFTLALFFVFLVLTRNVVYATPQTTNDNEEDFVLSFEPYTKDTIPDWAQDLRRAEIITLGSLPFTTLTSTFSYSIYRFIKNDFNKNYFPNPFPGSSSEANLNSDEQKTILVSAAVVSLVLGITDYIICTIKQKKIDKQVQEKDAIQSNILIITDNDFEHSGEIIIE